MPISLGSSNPEERSALSHAQERFTFETVQQASLRLRRARQ